MANVQIYGLVDPRTDEIRYVGQSVNPTHRLGQHIYEAEDIRGGAKRRWILDLLANGIRPSLRILAGVRKARADIAEKRWINRCAADGHRLLNAIPGCRERGAPWLVHTIADRMASK